MCMTDLKMCITCKQKCDGNLCELWFAESSVEIISLAPK